MLFFYDTRIDKLIARPGVTQEVETFDLKRGGEQPIEIQFGASAPDGAALSVQSEPVWTVEELPGTSEIWFGLKEETKYEGTLVCVEKTFTWDATNQWYSGSMDMNTTALNTLLVHDADDSNDVASVPLMAECKYRRSGSAPWAASINQITATVYHNVLDGSEGTPAEAADPTDYALTTATVVHVPTITSLEGGTSADLDSIVTTELDPGYAVSIMDADNGNRFSVYELENTTDATSAPDIIRPDDFAGAGANERVWYLRNPDKGMVWISSQTASADASLDFADLSATYAKYVVLIEDLLPATDASYLALRISDDNGTSYESGSGAYLYGWDGRDSGAGAIGGGSSSSTLIRLSSTVGTTAGEDGMTGTIEIVRPMNATKTKVSCDLSYMTDSASFAMNTGGGVYNTAIATDGFQLLFNTGNITSGSVHLFGVIDG